MPTPINPKTGETIGYYETKGTTAEPFNIPMLWQASSLSYVAMQADAAGNLLIVTGNPSITPESPATASVTGSSSQVVASNANRTSLVITNVGSVTVFFGLGATAVNNSGIALISGGSWTMDRYTFTTAAINAVCASSSTLAIQEFS